MKKYDKRYCKAVAKYGERACMDAASMINSGEGGYNIALSHGVLKKNGDVNTNAVGRQHRCGDLQCLACGRAIDRGRQNFVRGETYRKKNSCNLGSLLYSDTSSQR